MYSTVHCNELPRANISRQNYGVFVHARWKPRIIRKHKKEHGWNKMIKPKNGINLIETLVFLSLTLIVTINKDKRKLHTVPQINRLYSTVIYIVARSTRFICWLLCIINSKAMTITYFVFHLILQKQGMKNRPTRSLRWLFALLEHSERDLCSTKQWFFSCCWTTNETIFSSFFFCMNLFMAKA